MKIDRPLWGAGALLSPQQFQQQARWEAWTNECVARMSAVHPWGVQSASFDADALRLGKLKATRLRVRLPDGTLIDSDVTDRLPAAFDLARLGEDDVSGATLLLALPLEHANGGNCLAAEAKAAKPTRYRQSWKDVQDLYGDDSESMSVLEHELTLRLDTDENAEYLTCPVVRVLRDGQGLWSVDSEFIPPLLSFDAQPQLLGQLDNLMTQLAAKRTRLMGMRRESNQRMADFAVADVSLFWLLNALNSYHPVLADPRLCKVGAPDDVDHLVNAALDGVPLQPLSHVPAAIPMRLGNQYFAFDLSHPKARDMLAAGVCALYVPGTLGDVQLDLFAVLRS